MGIEAGLGALFGGDILGSLFGGAEALGTGIGELGSAIGTGFEGLVGGAGEALSSAASGVGDFLGLGGAEGVAGDVLPAAAQQTEFTSGLGSGITDLFGGGTASGTSAGGAVPDLFGTTSGIGQGAAQGAAAIPGTDPTGGGFWNSIVNGATSQLGKNPLGVAAAGAGLGLNLLKGNPTDPNQKKLGIEADQMAQQGQMLQSYLTSGTLPPALQQQLDQAKQSAKARLISNAAASGQPTDPSQNSALAAGLNSIDLNAVAAMSDQLVKMFQTGLNETGLSTQLYDMLVKLDKQDTTQLMNSIASFAAALGGSGTTKKAA